MKLQEKWTRDDYHNRRLHDWKPTPLIYPCETTEKDALHALKNAFTPLPPLKKLEAEAIENNTFIEIATPVPAGMVAFLENTAERCTSPTTKHSRQGMQGARHWVQRVATPEQVFRRLTDGYGISLMFGERFHQFIRNSNNWRGISGTMLDIDVFKENAEALEQRLIAKGELDKDQIKQRLQANERYPLPVYSLDELLSRYPLLARICSFIMPSASSLHEGRPFKARGIVLFDEPITDQRIYRAFGDILCGEIDCIPANVTKNPVSVGFGNTHNAPQAHYNTDTDKAWIAEARHTAAEAGKQEAQARKAQQKRRAERKQRNAKRQDTLNGHNGHCTGENISAFIETCDAMREMESTGLLKRGKGNEYRWHAASSDRSCELMGDGVLHIFSHTMQDASPAGEGEPVNAHRFYLYQLTGLDITLDSDKPKCREYLFEKGYGNDPKAFTPAVRPPKLTRTPPAQHSDPTPAAQHNTLDENTEHRVEATKRFISSNETELLQIQLVRDDTGTGKTQTALETAAAHRKRTLSLAETTDLAAQQTDTALSLGFTDTLHIKGRGTNYDESGVADIPSAERTAEHFDKVVCPQNDEVEKIRRAPHRLPAQWYCHSQCHLKEPCLKQGYLSQFVGLGDKDFIVTANPNLFFDPNLHAYLNGLVSTEKAEPTEIDYAFDAMMGTDTDTKKETDTDTANPLEYGIIDDYTINTLFTDIVFSEAEFKTLKQAWAGTPTGDFAGKVLKAFKKKKPHKIMKALRKAIDQTAEHHTEIAERLTQHARHGTVTTSTLPEKAYLATKMVEYIDGGKQFIPSDYQPTHDEVMALASELPSVEKSPLIETTHADRDAQVIALHQDGKDKDAIHKKTGISPDTIVRIVKHSEKHKGVDQPPPRIKSTYIDNRLENIRKAYAYKALRKEGIPCIQPDSLDGDIAIGTQVIVPHAYTTALAACVKLADLTPRWQRNVTPVQLLKMLFDYTKNDKNAPISKRYTLGNESEKPNAVIEFSIPPQAPVGTGIKKLTMLSATTDTADVRNALDGQPVTFSDFTGQPLPHADGVQVYQYPDARLTSASIFEYETENDKRLLQEKPVGLTETAEKRIAKLNQFAKDTDGLTAFISYKEFTEQFKEHLDGFKVVRHYDKMAGLNLDGLKLLVVFGYPKVKHDVVIAQARKQYATDTEPLPKGDKHKTDDNGKHISEYEQLTEVDTYSENGLYITERRYINTRLEKIRRQLATDKLKQAVGRARLIRWTDTTTIIFTNTPIKNTTARAVFFSDAALETAEQPRGLGEAQQRIDTAIENGDVEAVMEATGKSRSTAYRQTQPARDQQKAAQDQQKADRDAQIITLHRASEKLPCHQK